MKQIEISSERYIIYQWNFHSDVKKFLYLWHAQKHLGYNFNEGLAEQYTRAGTNVTVLAKIGLTYFPKPLKLIVHYFYQIFIFSPNDSPSKTTKNVFYFIEKALLILEIFKFL